AHRGTLFVDDVADLDDGAQSRLRIAIDERRVAQPDRDRVVDVQLIAGTRRDLATLVREGRFRRDLHDRLAAIVLRIPPLRERPDDIAQIAAAVIADLRKEMGRPNASLSFEACAALSAYPWPGNERELRNVLEWSLLGAEQEEIRGRQLGLASAPDPAASEL